MRSPNLSLSIVATIVAIAALAAFYEPLMAGENKAAPVSKQAMLANIGAKVLAPAYADLATKADLLSAAADAFAARPDAVALERAQSAWKQTLLAWRRTQAFAHGPVEELGAAPRIQFWPPRKQAVDRVLQSPRPIDAAYIQELGANAVGLSALEVLLFDAGADNTARAEAFKGPAGERRRLYMQAAAHDVAQHARLVAHAWQGPAGYVATFGAGGQAQLNLLVNDLLEAVETGAENRLRVVIERHAEREFRSTLLENGPSETSQQGMLAMLVGAKAVFSGASGAGIDDYLGQLNAPTARRLDAQFQKAIDAVRALAVPLDQAIAARPQAVIDAHEQCRALEILLKVEGASALGVTLTFKAIDGD